MGDYSDILANIKDVVSRIKPFDEVERLDIEEALLWIDSGKQIFRIAKPDNPPKHLVSYFILLDKVQQKILLVDHKNACLWLPTGGHVELGEHPKITVQRECFEELGIEAKFLYDEPIFMTSTITVGYTSGHTDVSLWYVLEGDANSDFIFDKDEFNNIAWYGFEEIPFGKSDPHMKRFMQKLTSAMSSAHQ